MGVRFSHLLQKIIIKFSGEKFMKKYLLIPILFLMFSANINSEIVRKGDYKIDLEPLQFVCANDTINAYLVYDVEYSLLRLKFYLNKEMNFVDKIIAGFIKFEKWDGIPTFALVENKILTFMFDKNIDWRFAVPLEYIEFSDKNDVYIYSYIGKNNLMERIKKFYEIKE